MYVERVLRKGLKTQVFGKKIYTFDTIDSTNNCAKAVADCGADEGTVIIAEDQTAGKGRLGRPWLSTPNQNLTFSVVVRPPLQNEGLNLLPLYAAVAVAEAIERATSLHTECKWPNDLLINKKKVGGILIEGSFKDAKVEYAVIGIGINVNQVVFSSDLSQTATSLRNELHADIDRAHLFQEILRSLEHHYKQNRRTAFQSIVPTWLSHSSMLEKTITVSQQGNLVSGVVKGLSQDGGLILQMNGTTKTLFAGDVTVLEH
jgi:BirA family biotin operon repressor/biotin-[acetyl-CoA-carboxylase] ligase